MAYVPKNGVERCNNSDWGDKAKVMLRIPIRDRTWLALSADSSATLRIPLGIRSCSGLKWQQGKSARRSAK